MLAVALAAGCGDAATTTSAPGTTTPPPTTTAAVTSVPATAVTSTSSTTTTAVPPPATTRPPATTTTEDGVFRIAVDFAGGEVVGGFRQHDVAGGALVELTVTADVTDEVHVHGYDVFGEVAPGAPAVIEFVADIPGIFEVELEGAGAQLVELVVS